MRAWRQTATRWWYVLRYHRPSQLVMRLVSVVRRQTLRLTKGRGYSRPPREGLQPRQYPALSPIFDWRLQTRRVHGLAANAPRIAQGIYRFLNQERAMANPVDWRLASWPEAPRLWRFYLHYHEYLLDLAAAGREGADPSWSARAWQTVGDWIERNRLEDPRVLCDAWHPYCISRRVPVWILLWSASEPPAGLRGRVLESLFAQTSFLNDHLEWDLSGNHLMENLRALVFAGAFVEHPASRGWLERVETILPGQLRAQVLPHGEHFERSPMYHAIMLDAVLDMRDLLAPLRPKLAVDCAETAARMARFLRGILHPDGEIPLLGDACLGEAPPALALIERAGESCSLENAHE